MTFRFVHTSDWHLAKSFERGFSAEQGPLLREARARIVDSVGELARAEGANYVLVAGDVFDKPLVADALLRKLAIRLAHFDDIHWHFLPGNHDPAQVNGVWPRFMRFVESSNVTTHMEAGCTAIAEGVELLTAPLRARAISHDPTAWMVEHSTSDRALRIGLAHGAVQGFGSERSASVLIEPNRAETAKLDYLALGDWHGHRVAGPKAWYSGTPEPDGFPDNEPGYALLVELDGPGAAPLVTPRQTAHYNWHKIELADDPLLQLDDVEDMVQSSSFRGDRWLLQLICCGRISVENELKLRERIARITELTFHTEADFQGLVVHLAQGPNKSFADDALLAMVAERLGEQMVPDHERSSVAHEALRLLAQFAHQHEQGG